MKIAERYAYLRKRFDRRAIQYQRNPVTHWVGRSELAALRSMIPAPARPGETPALDFGCGGGRATTLLLEMGYRVTGYDLSPAMLEQARIAIGGRPDVRFTSDPKTISGPWPLIVAFGVLDYYPESTPLWQEWRRLLLPGGRLIVTTPNVRSPLAQFYVFSSRHTCQAYATTLEAIEPTAESMGFYLTGMQMAFPRQWWGHTIVFGFQLQTQE